MKWIVRVDRLWIAGALVLSLFGCGLNADGPPITASQIRPAAFVSDVAATPEVVSSHGVATLEIAAVINSTNGLPSFLYEGGYVAPTIRVNPGDTLVVDFDDELPPGKGLASDVNLHFHGLNVSPRRPADDVITMFAKSGRTLYYSVPIPVTQPPGLYWYHPHIHGQTNIQVGQGGMSGAIVVGGIAAHVPALSKMPERLLIVRELGNNGGEARHHDGAPKGGMDSMGSIQAIGTGEGPTTANVPCAPLLAGDYETVNSQLRPTIRFNPGKPQFFRILNATGHRHLDLTLGGIAMHVVGIDGYPVDTYPGQPSSFAETHVVVPAAGRVEFYATLTAATDFRSQCFDSGPIGDSDPAEVLAHLRPFGTASRTERALASLEAPRAAARFETSVLSSALPPPAATRVVRFSEDAKGFYINGRAYSPNEAPVFVVHVGTVERWTVENLTLEDHDFHLHQVHFHVETVDGVPVKHSLWQDTVVVPHGTRLPNGSVKHGTITLIADFREQNIRGTFLFHCHILDHEDGGMMAKIRAI
jgi:suppressor of ftsI